MQRAVKDTKIFAVPRIFRTDCKFFVCAKGKHRKGNISPDSPKNKAVETVF